MTAKNNETFNFALLAYVFARQLTLFVSLVLVPFVIVQLLTSALPRDYITSLYGNLYPVFFTSVTLHLILLYWAPVGAKTATQLLSVRGGKLCSIFFGLISAAMLAAWIFMAYTVIFSDTGGDMPMTILFFVSNLTVTTVLTRYFWRGLFKTKKHDAISEQLWSVVDRGVAAYRRLARTR